MDFLKAPVAVAAGAWRMVTVCYSATNTALWLDDELVATGEGMMSPPSWVEQDLGLVVGSDVMGWAESSAQAQFEELTTFDYWPEAERQRLYYAAVSRQAALGPVGTAAEEAVKQEWLKASRPEGMAKDGDSNEPLEAYDYGSNALWLEITGVTNDTANLVIHPPSEGLSRD